jgi:hypothetical protein
LQFRTKPSMHYLSRFLAKMNPWGKEGRNSSNRLEVNIYDCPFKEDWNRAWFSG